MVTVDPATGAELLVVTRYFATTPATVVMVPLVPASPRSLAVIVVATPAVVLVVTCTVAAPLLAVALVAAVYDPRESDLVDVTMTAWTLTGLRVGLMRFAA